MVTCPTCGAENREGVKFCGECGSALSLPCPACTALNEPGRKFCGECGAALTAAARATPAPAVDTAPAAERRVVSVLFADLVGFTPLSESRDAEEVRELLTRYFDTCRRLIELYGGVVEKFIGDAVMAVWGTPVAQEDDAERAVRAALDLVAAVSSLGDEVGAPDLQARAGVLTGEAAVNLGAVGEGMVAGDLVNTAARIQAAADGGSVFVGETTRRASEQAIAFEAMGEHELKGKAEPVPLWRAVRVTAAVGGALRSEGLEAPFVGRDRELRLVKELFHASAAQSRAQLVQVTGIAGIGKSRLAWEFFKYLDGLADLAWWHRGRCLAYGEGVAYWALAEMVRTRAQILEGEEQAAAREKLDACLAEHLTDAEERSWVGPRLANLLGLEERVDTDRQDLFAAWRLFFERLAEENPTVLVFEDLQWADQALLAFVEYLLEWSGSHRLYVLALSRPELAGEHPDFARGVRNSTTLALEPLSDGEMAQLLDGYAPGLPAELKQQVLGRAQGVPLYAVETIRMLLDRGLLVRAGSVYEPTGPITTLEVPETLHALAAARLDGLPAEERALVSEACVLGKTFTKQALCALNGRDASQVEPLLASLVRKEVLSIQADARWPERGQYGFLQELLRSVAYETLSRRDRKARHLAAVAALGQTFEGADQEVPEVIASHLLAAADAAPQDPDTPEIHRRARSALVQAGERAAGLAAPEEAQRHFDHAATLAEDDARARATLLERAGTLALQTGDTAAARERLELAIALFEREGDAHAAARASVALADVDLGDGQLEEGTRRFAGALSTLEQGGPSAELAETYASLGRLQMLRGDPGAAATLERALRLSEVLALTDTFVQALTSRAMVLLDEGRVLEARLLLEGALARSHAGNLGWWRAANNLSMVLQHSDELHQALAVNEDIAAQARQRGDLERLVMQRASSIGLLVWLGRWQEALERADETRVLHASDYARAERVEVIPVLCERGAYDAAEAILEEHEWERHAEHKEVATTFATVEARLLRARNRLPEAVAAAERAFTYLSTSSLTNGYVRRALVQLLEASVPAGNLDRVDELLAMVDGLQPGELTPSLRANAARFRARVDAMRGNLASVDRNFGLAEAGFAGAGFEFDLAVVRLEHAESLLARGLTDQAEPLRAEARAAFERLEATPWLERLAAGARVEIPVA